MQFTAYTLLLPFCSWSYEELPPCFLFERCMRDERCLCSSFGAPGGMCPGSRVANMWKEKASANIWSEVEEDWECNISYVTALLNCCWRRHGSCDVWKGKEKKIQECNQPLKQHGKIPALSMPQRDMGPEQKGVAVCVGSEISVILTQPHAGAVWSLQQVGWTQHLFRAGCRDASAWIPRHKAPLGRVGLWTEGAVISRVHKAARVCVFVCAQISSSFFMFFATIFSQIFHPQYGILVSPSHKIWLGDKAFLSPAASKALPLGLSVWSSSTGALSTKEGCLWHHRKCFPSRGEGGRVLLKFCLLT